MHELVRWDRAVRLDAQASIHTNNWVAIAARHLVDELLLASERDRVRDRDQLRVRDRVHQPAVRRAVGARARRRRPDVREDGGQHPERRGAPRPDRRARARDRRRSTIARYAQYLLDKWFWRSWLLFAVVTGFAMDYLTPLEHRHELVQGVHAGVGARSVPALARRVRPANARGTGTPSSRRSTTITTWSTRARTRYRASVWFDFVVPGPDGARLAAREVSRRRGPTSIRSGSASPSAGARADPGNDFAVHGTAIVGVLRSVPARAVRTARRARTPPTSWSTAGSSYIFCSRARAAGSSSRSPSATPGTRTSSSACSRARRPANLVALVQRYFGLDYETWGKDALRRRLSLAAHGGGRHDPALRLSRRRHDRPPGAGGGRRFDRRARAQAAGGGAAARGDRRAGDGALRRPAASIRSRTVADAGMQPLARFDVRRGPPA